MDEETRQEFKKLNQKLESLVTLVESFKESLEREIHGVAERIDRTDAHLHRIAAGAHYVTRLVDWSEKQDVFATDIVQRVQKLESAIEELKRERH